MPLGEFALIDHYFRKAAETMLSGRRDVILGIGDDAALLKVPPGYQLVAALDTLVEGRHFPRGTPPESLGHRVLAVNLSDLAAMGAKPAWFLLSLTMPDAREELLEGLSRGVLQLAQAHGIVLVGGDTTAGPLSVSVQVLGLVEEGTALQRSKAQAGDLLFVSGTPGDAAAGLALEMRAEPGRVPRQDYLRSRFLYPEPRVELGRVLRGVATACIDVSDGLAADAGKLARASGCGLRLDAGRLPLSADLMAEAGSEALRLALTGGDDYELCFAVPPSRTADLQLRLANVKCPVTCIGVLEREPGVRAFLDAVPVGFDLGGYDHFSAPG